MPSRIHQADSDDSRASETVANGTPLSVRMRSGRPNSAEHLFKDCFSRSAPSCKQALATEQVSARMQSVIVSG